MPAAERIFSAPSTTGPANGSSSDGYAAVFGRCSGGRLAIHSANTLAWSVATACCEKKMYLKPRLYMSGEPHDGHTNSMLFFSATAEDGMFSSDDWLPSTRLTLSLEIRLL